MPTKIALEIRRASRAILLTKQHEVLLIKIKDPTGSWEGWIAPGGGVNPGESETAALLRELEEELGARQYPLGPAVWRREHEFPWNSTFIKQSEQFYLVSTDRFEPRSHLNPDATEKAFIKEMRWWSLAELETSKETFVPKTLYRFLKQLIEKGPPAQPIDVGT